MKTVAITGISGYIGNALVQRLEQHEDVNGIVGIDLKEPRSACTKLKFHCRDICEPFGDILVENKVVSAIHLAFAVKPTHDYVNARRINIDGSRNFLEACQQASVKHVVYLSSHTVYGAHPDNPIPLTEDSPLRPIRGFQYSWDKAEADRMFQDFMKSHADVSVTIVRPCFVLGPKGHGSVSTGMFKPVMMRLIGYDPQLQFIHEDDLADLLSTLISQREPGVFNVAGEGSLSYRQVIAATRKPCVALPASLMAPLMAISWRLHLQSESPPAGTEFIKYPIVISTAKVKKATGFQIRYSSYEALLSYIGAEQD